MAAAPEKKYQQRRPEKTILYRVIQQHLESFRGRAHESSGKPLPNYVENEFRRYLATRMASRVPCVRPAGTSSSCPSRASDAGSVQRATRGACRTPPRT